jgi:predicted TIM-barrel fold metal-dependent hydrolase
MLPHMRKHEGMQFIVDHCGVLRPSAADQARGMHNPALLEYSLAYASLPNVSIMWAKANTLSQEAFPHEDIGRYLRRFIDEFGADRILWGSDSTQTRGKDTWAQSLLYIEASTLITAEEKEWVLGKTAQRILGWPREQSPYGDAFDVYEASTWRETEVHLANASLNDRRRR